MIRNAVLVLLLATIGLGSGSCGVEVGNPHPKPGSGKSGTLTLSLADAPIDRAKHVYLNIVGLSVTPLSADGTSGVAESLSLAQSGKIDALALSKGKTLALASGQALAVGSYSGVVLELDEENPGTVVEEDDREHPLRFADVGKGFFVAQEFEVVEGEELSVTLHVDLRRSLKQLDDGGQRRFDFGPVAHMIRKGDDATIVGANLPPEAASVCAYLRRKADFGAGKFDRLPPKGGKHPPPPEGKGEIHAAGPGGPGEMMGEGHYDTKLVEFGGGAPGTALPGVPPPPEGEKFGPPPPPPHQSKFPPSLGPDGGELAADGDASCPNAFATAEVEAGTFNLSHLWPGQYLLQFFTEDGLPLQMPPPLIEVAPGQIVELPPPPGMPEPGTPSKEDPAAAGAGAPTEPEAPIDATGEAKDEALESSEQVPSEKVPEN